MAGFGDEERRAAARSGAVTMAGYITWLAGRGLPRAQRYAMHHEVERFLLWRDRTPARRPEDLRDAVRRYLDELRAEGADAAATRLTGTALESLIEYEEQFRGPPGGSSVRDPDRSGKRG